MDIKKLNIPTLDGPNWGQYDILLQAAACILDCYDVLRGKILTPPPNPTYDLLTIPINPGAQASTTDLATYNAMKAIWNKKNAQVLGLMQATASPVIWQNYVQYGIANDLFDALETEFGKVAGASTYLQLVNMVKIQFTNLMEFLPQIQQFQDNYNHIILNGHSRLSKDLPTFMFCSSLPESYKLTGRQYHGNCQLQINGHHCTSTPRRV